MQVAFADSFVLRTYFEDAPVHIGAEDRRNVGAACALSALALLLLGHWILGPESSASAHSVSSATTTTPSAVPGRKIKTSRSDSLDPTLHSAQLELTEREVYEGSGRNIFQSNREDQPEKIPPMPAPSPLPPDTIHSPAAPTIRLKFFGVATMSSLPRKACLLQDGDVFIGAEGEIVDSHYKILRIGIDTVDVKDLLDNRAYPLTLQQ